MAMLANAYRFSGPTNPIIGPFDSTLPPILPPTMCASRCGSSVQPLPNPNGAGPMPSPVGGPGQPANTLASGVRPRGPSPAIQLPPTLGVSPQVGGPVSGCAGCRKNFAAEAPWWAWLLMGLGALAILKRVTS